MNIREIVIDVLASMANGTGEAKSEDLLLKKVLETHSELISHQPEIRNVISELIDEGIIIHDSKMKNWIRLNRKDEL